MSEPPVRLFAGGGFGVALAGVDLPSHPSPRRMVGGAGQRNEITVTIGRRPVKDPDIIQRSPQEELWIAGRFHATNCHAVGLLALAFNARPDPWLTDWQLEAWVAVPDAEAWGWYRLGFEAGPYPDLIAFRERQGWRRSGA